MTPSQMLRDAPGPTYAEPSLCVLVAEDDVADAYLITRALEAQPSVRSVILAVDGAEALAFIDSGLKPDLALVDLHMPRMDGLGLLDALATRAGAGFPVVVLTSSTSTTDAARSRLGGALRVVTKPDTAEGFKTAMFDVIHAVCPISRADAAAL